MPQETIFKLVNGPTTLELSRGIKYHEFCPGSRLSRKPDTQSYLGTLVWGQGSQRNQRNPILQLQLGYPSLLMEFYEQGMLTEHRSISISLLRIHSPGCTGTYSYLVFLTFSQMIPEGPPGSSQLPLLPQQADTSFQLHFPMPTTALILPRTEVWYYIVMI